ncbi:MAG: hypothetical protein AAFX06_30380, partial [Planctomycetota bacterium]
NETRIMIEDEMANRLIDDWIAYRDTAAAMLVKHLGLELAVDVLRPEHRGRHEIPNTGWAYRTHGVGVDVTRTNGHGGIDFDFAMSPDLQFAPPDVYRLLLFARRAVHDRSVDTTAYTEFATDPERCRPVLQAALQRRLAAYNDARRRGNATPEFL